MISGWFIDLECSLKNFLILFVVVWKIVLFVLSYCILKIDLKSGNGGIAIINYYRREFENSEKGNSKTKSKRNFVLGDQ